MMIKEWKYNSPEYLNGIKMVFIPKEYDTITMNTTAKDNNDKSIQISGTYGFGALLSWYDHTNKRWIDKWKFVKG